MKANAQDLVMAVLVSMGQRVLVAQLIAEVKVRWLFVCVCMYVYVCMCVYVCVYVCMHERTCIMSVK